METIEAQQFYGIDAAEWLRRWDNGDIVWSVEMGGLGPGYEQCIQITAAEALRFLINSSPDKADLEDEAKWRLFREKIDQNLLTNEVVKRLGLSGAQAGAAVNIAVRFYIDQPYIALQDKRIKDRLIQVQNKFPG